MSIYSHAHTCIHIQFKIKQRIQSYLSTLCHWICSLQSLKIHRSTNSLYKMGYYLPTYSPMYFKLSLDSLYYLISCKCYANNCTHGCRIHRCGYLYVLCCSFIKFFFFFLKYKKGRERLRIHQRKGRGRKQMEECEGSAPSDNTLTLEVVKNLHLHKINDRGNTSVE